MKIINEKKFKPKLENCIYNTSDEWQVYFLSWSIPKNILTFQLQIIKEVRGVGE
jgi:hypothetical protein